MHEKAFARAIELKGEENDPTGIVTKALEDLQKAIDERLKKSRAMARTPGADGN